MKKDEDKVVVLRSFTNIKNLETKVYKIGNIKLLAPIALQSLGLFILVDAVMVFINLLINLPFKGVTKFLIIPALLTMFLKKAEIDGKPPHMYVLRLLEYQRIKGATIEQFEFKEKDKVIEFE
ncbi:TcpE family conjugal transfer membrane protein (plasmid) [Clostridium baratii]